eukprot:TRINITY_DN3624_c0_g1_i1.p2 TRINITY_DN3624_c0_g1~~TRINITY_DN3624_c0_g1_i1.p2  ORF type:complete len:73 (-),score=19.45 TRINITY_DN3624_c0_g1_i1:89-307(-)
MQKLKVENGETLTAIGLKIAEVEEALTSKVKKGIEEVMKEAKHAKEGMEEARVECEIQKRRRQRRVRSFRRH